MLRKGGTPEDEFRPGDMVSFMRKQKTGGWTGPARVIARENKNYWLLHSGIPVLIASNRIRASNAEEHLEHELLHKSRLRKRKEPFLPRAAVEPMSDSIGGGQQIYVDMRRGEDEEEGLLSPKKARRDATGSASELPRESEPARPAEGQVSAEEMPLPEDNVEEELAGENDKPEDGIDRKLEILQADPVGPKEPSELERAMTRNFGNQLDVGADRARTMVRPAEERETDRSRSPQEERHLERDDALMAQAAEFSCFLAKRKKPDAGTKEWNFERAEKEMQDRLRVSRGKEWSNWMTYKAVRFPDEAEVQKLLKQGEKAVPMKWVDLDKNEKLRVPGGPEVPEKWKSRLVIRGDLEQDWFRTDCPTASSTTIHILLSWAATKKYRLKSGDISAAFLQGSPIERLLLIKAPRDGIQVDQTQGAEDIPPYTYMIALMSVYGSKDAPRGFWLALRKDLVGNGLTEVEPAFYTLADEGVIHGLLCSHVDDLLWAGGTLMDELMTRVQKRFTFGSTDEDNFRFCGRKLVTTEDRFEITCPESLAKVKPIFIQGGRLRLGNEDGTSEEQGQMRAVLGSIGWVARLCRPELCYKCSALQGKQNKPKVEDLRETNKFLAAAQKTSANGLNFVKGKFDFQTAVLLSVTDASHAAELHYSGDGKPKGYGSQAGRFLLLADRMPNKGMVSNFHVLEWQSNTLKRVCRSTLQAEVLSSMQGSESAHQVRYTLYALNHPKIPGDRGLTWKVSVPWIPVL